MQAQVAGWVADAWRHAPQGLFVAVGFNFLMQLVQVAGEEGLEGGYEHGEGRGTGRSTVWRGKLFGKCLASTAN